MTDLGERIKDAVTASVRDAEPEVDVLSAVYARHRRGRRLRAAIGAAAAMVVVAGALTLAARPWESVPPTTGPHRGQGAAFPGGGRMLLESGGRLRWLYSDGRVARIPGRFSAARVSAGELLAWKYSGPLSGYYTMTLSGQAQRWVLPMTWSRRLSVIQADLSPDRSQIAYIRQDIASATSVTDTLWIKNLATGRTVPAGKVASDGFTWLGSGTLVATAPDGHSLLAISAASGTRRLFLAASDPALARVYEKARPGAGPPAYIITDGVPSTGPTGRMAVWLAAAKRSAFPTDGAVTDAAEIILQGRRPVAVYAPPTPGALGLIWGPDGLFALQTGAGDKPGSWRTYVGAVGHDHAPQSGRLSPDIAYGQNGAIFSPNGTVLALADSGMETLVPVPDCGSAFGTRCLKFGPTVLPRFGVIEAWLPLSERSSIKRGEH